MNILMTLANPFSNDPRVYNEAKSLVDSGHQVTVLAWDKTGKYPKKEIKDEIKILRSCKTKLIGMTCFNFIFWDNNW
jgi:hypothetical protein